MRVLFISDVYFPRVNGVSTSIRTFRQDLASAGVDTCLVAPSYDPPRARSAAPETPPDEPGVLRVPATRVPRDPEDRRMGWRALTRTLDALPGGRFDLVHIHTPFIAHYAGVRFARRAEIAAIATYHTFFEEYLHHYMPLVPRPLARFLARSFTRSQCAAVQALIAPSEPMRAVLTGYGVTTPIHVLPTGLGADRFRPGDGRAFRARAGIDARRPLVTYIGRVAHEKNIGFLLRMFREVMRSVPEALLVIAGEGPAREALRQQAAHLGIAGHVHFAGYLERDSALLDCYAAADVFVFASRTETQGLVLLEAMAQGTPVVSTAQLGTRSILVPGSGALVAPEEPAAFAAAVVRVLGDEGLRQELGKHGLAYARQWSSAAMARRLAELYAELRGAPRALRVAADDFRPPRWLRNRHLQSMLASTAWRRGGVLRRAVPLLAAQREVLLDCGAGVRLQCFVSSPAPGPAHPVVLLHGWEGSADSLYLLSLAQLLFEQRFEVVRLNLRDHGDTHHLNRELFHSCRLPEVVGAVRALQQHFAARPLQLVGFSLGGNFMLRVAAQAREAGLDLERVIAVSPVLDPGQTLTALERVLPLYELYFVRKWRRSLRRKQAAWPGDYDFGGMERLRGLRRMTAEMVRCYTEFATLEDYLNGYAITGARLATLEVPSTILTSLDDPIIPAEGLARLARPAALSITVSRYGGHCGFFEGLTAPNWLERRILAELGGERLSARRASPRTAPPAGRWSRSPRRR